LTGTVTIKGFIGQKRKCMWPWGALKKPESARSECSLTRGGRMPIEERKWKDRPVARWSHQKGPRQEKNQDAGKLAVEKKDSIRGAAANRRGVNLR